MKLNIFVNHKMKRSFFYLKCMAEMPHCPKIWVGWGGVGSNVLGIICRALVGIGLIDLPKTGAKALPPQPPLLWHVYMA
jgi:hypothetical protein